MAEEEPTALNPKPSPKQSSLCEECCSNPSKYKCPGCSIRCCSLPCVKAHKHRTSCTGKKLQTQFVPLSQFNDNLLISDYNLLEETKRITESAQKLRAGLCLDPYFKIPYKLRNLRNAAARRKTQLLLLPRGMSKREKNQSRYDQRKKFIFWTIEWRFHSTNAVLFNHGVHENTSLCSIIEKHLKPGPWNHPLKPFCNEPLDCLKFFIQKNPKSPRSPFRELDVKAPLCQQLANIVIMEYPIIHVFLPSQSYDFEVVKDADSSLQKPLCRESINNYLSSPKSVAFREEEIEDDISPDPKVLDLMNPLNPGTVGDFRFPNGGAHTRDRRAEKEVTHSSDRQHSIKFGQGTKPMLTNEFETYKAEESNTYFNSKSKEVEVAEGMDFDFEQDLRDAYSGLIAEVNPDDFLNLEEGFANESGLDALSDPSNFNGMFSMEEELEEGEIPWL